MKKLIRKLRKYFYLIKNVFRRILYKIVYRNQFEMSFNSTVKGKLSIDMLHGGACKIGKYLSSAGPLYIKCVNDGKLTIGKNCYFNHNCSITCGEKIEIGNRCIFANNVVIIDHDHKIVPGHGAEEALVSSPIKLDNSVWCGANVTLLKGIHIGEGSVIAAGAVVRTDIPAHSLAAGVPARVIKEL